MKSSGVIYQFEGESWRIRRVSDSLVRLEAVKPWKIFPFRKLGLGLLMVALGGLVGPLLPEARLETGFYLAQAKTRSDLVLNPPKPLPPAVPVVFNPLTQPDGSVISPVDPNFSLIIPKIGVNSKVIPSVDPADPVAYSEALKTGVAHASTSFFPDQNGTVYLFSHSTNYDWFVKDLNAVFYLLKNLNTGDLIVISYKGKLYTYKLTDQRIVASDQISYLTGQPGTRSLILQTCWPPGSTAERLLIFADLVKTQGEEI